MLFCRFAAALSGRLLPLVVLAALLPGLTVRTVHAQSALIDIGTGTGRPGDEVDVTVSFRYSGAPPVAATINDLTFYKRSMSLDPEDCVVNPTTGKSLATAILYDTAASRTIRLFVQSIFSPPPIPEGPLYTCTFRIKPTALPGRKALIIDTARAFGPTGAEVPGVTGSGGTVMVTIVLVPSATPTPSRTATPTPSPTVAPSLTATPSPTSMADSCPSDLMLDPVAGPRGSTVKFAGQCVLVRDGRRAAVLFDDLRLSNVAGDAIGHYEGVFEIPSDARFGTHLIRVLSPREIAAASFEVTSPSACEGDCNNDGVVGVDDLLHAVTIVLGDTPTSSCESLDTNGDGSATIDELVNAVQRALEGCNPPSG